MYPQPERREMGKGAIPSLGKIQKITPEWQTEQLRSVDSVVARVKGKHHDGDVSKLGGVFMPSNQVVPRALSSCVDERAFLLKGGESKAWISFQTLAYLKRYHDLFAEQRYRKSKGFEAPPTFLISKQKWKNRTIIHTKEKIYKRKNRQNTKEHLILKSIYYHFKEEFKCTTKSPIT